MRKLIILEINEVPHRIYDLYKKQNPKSPLTQLLKKSRTYTTISTDQGELHPWSTWPTLYRGVDNTIHHIKDIGENLSAINEKYPSVWEMLIENKISTGIFSSLHTYPLPPDFNKYDFLVPDPFAIGSAAHPKKIEPFQAFNLSMTKKSGRSVDKGIDKKSALKLALALPGLGIKLKTIIKTMKQLAVERVKPWRATRRRSFQSILAFDLYFKLLKKHQPSFTTFFSNHVASALHRYWAATFPEDYETMNLPDEWINRYKNEIPFCMDELNEMVKSVKDFVDKNSEYKLIIASSMGQAATTAKLIKSEIFFANPSKFQNYFSQYEIEALPAMHPQYNFNCDSNPDAFENQLKQIKLNGESLKYRRKEASFFSIDLGYPNINEVDITLDGEMILAEDLGIEIKQIDDQSGGTAYHIPEGALFIYDPKNPISDSGNKSMDLRAVAPAILKNFDTPIPAYMKQEGKFQI